MKYLVAPNSATPVIFALTDSAKFLGADAKTYDTAIVTDIDERLVSSSFAAALTAAQVAIRETEAKSDAPRIGDSIGVPFGTGGPFSYMEKRDVTRDVKFIARSVIDVPDGTAVTIKVSGRGISLDIPEGATPDRTAGLKVGVTIAVGPNISPKALMNARGVVKSVNGTKVLVTLDEGDLDRVKRATGKPFQSDVRLPKVCVEVIG